MAYLIQLEQVRQQANTAVLAAVLARSQGSDTPIPNPAQLEAEFNAALAAEPEWVTNPDEYLLKQALGLR